MNGESMTPEQRARQAIDRKLGQSGWVIQDMRRLNPLAAIGVAVREFPTSTGPVDYALFVDGVPVGIIEAKKSEAGEHITDVEMQSGRYAHSTFRWATNQEIRFAFSCRSSPSDRLLTTERTYSTA